MKKISGNVRNYPSNSKLPSSTVINYGSGNFLDIFVDFVEKNVLKYLECTGK
jgi:hypothetical protein